MKFLYNFVRSRRAFAVTGVFGAKKVFSKKYFALEFDGEETCEADPPVNITLFFKWPNIFSLIFIKINN